MGQKSYRAWDNHTSKPFLSISRLTDNPLRLHPLNYRQLLQLTPTLWAVSVTDSLRPSKGCLQPADRPDRHLGATYPVPAVRAVIAPRSILHIPNRGRDVNSATMNITPANVPTQLGMQQLVLSQTLGIVVTASMSSTQGVTVSHSSPQRPLPPCPTAITSHS